MRVRKNTLYTKDLAHIQTLHIPYSDLEKEVRKGIKEEGLYFLETIFGECDGHGCGIGGEDISFTLPRKSKFNRKPYHLIFEINESHDA